MSKHDIRCKRILTAVLLAISVQFYHVQPVWAAAELNAAGNEGASIGVTTIKGVKLTTGGYTDLNNEDMSMASADGAATWAVNNSPTFTLAANTTPILALAADSGLALALGSSSQATGWNSTAIGGSAASTAGYSTSLGTHAKAYSLYSTAVGSLASAGDSTDIAKMTDTVAIGFNATAVHTNSIAMGSNSTTTAEKQVSFGTYDSTLTTDDKWSLRRSLAGISDVEMKGALTGVTTINGASFTTGGRHNYTDDNDGSYSVETSIAIGDRAKLKVDANNNIVANATAIGSYASAARNATAVGQGADANFTNSIAVGASSNVLASNGVSVGYMAYTHAKAGISLGYFAATYGENNIALGVHSEAGRDGTTIPSKNAIAIGTYAEAPGENSIALGANSIAGVATKTEGGVTTPVISNATALGAGAQAIHLNSVAIGTNSVTAADNQVSFGVYDSSATGDDQWTTRRKLVGISDIRMNGSLNGVTGINNLQVFCTGKASGLMVGNNAIIGQEYKPFSSIGFSVAADGALNAKTVNGAKIAAGIFNGVEVKKNGSNYVYGDVDITALNTTVGNKANADASGLSDGNKTSWKAALGMSALETTVAGKAANSTVMALDTAYKAEDAKIKTDFAAADTKIREDFATADTALQTSLQTNIDTKVAQSAYDTKIGELTSADAKIKTDFAAADTKIRTDFTAADTKIREDFAAADTTLQTSLQTNIDAKANADASGLSDGNKTSWKAALGVSALETTVAGKADDSTVTALDTAYKAADTKVREDFAAADTALQTSLQTNIDAKVSQTDYNAKMTVLDNADTALSGRATALETATIGMSYASGMTTFVGGVTAKNIAVGTTGYGFAADGALKALTVNGVSISGTDAAKDAAVGGYSLKTISENIKSLQENGGATSANTVGISHTGEVNTANSVTTIEGSTSFTTAGGIATNAITATGKVTANEFVENGKNLAAKYAAIDAVYTKLAAETTFAKADGTNLPTDVTNWQSKLGISAINNTLTGINYNATTGTTIGGVTLLGGALGNVSALNGSAIAGDSSNGITIDGVNLKNLKTTVDGLTASGGAATENTKGIARTDVDTTSGDGKTTIEKATSFTIDGMETANLSAATAAIGGVNFAAGGVMTNVTSINGVGFSSDGKIGGVALNGGKVNGIDVTALSNTVAGLNTNVTNLGNRVTTIEHNGGGSGSGGSGTGGTNTDGITHPESGSTTIEGNTTITQAGDIKTNTVTANDMITVGDTEADHNKTVISKDNGILVNEGEQNQVKINKDGIHVGLNSSVMDDENGFITDKGLYIGVASSSDTSAAKFSIDKSSGMLTSKVGNATFTNSGDGAKFSHTDANTVFIPNGATDTTIKGNTVKTGHIDTDVLYVGGNEVNVAGGIIEKTDAVDNKLEGTDAEHNTVTNDFTTSALNGTTQSSEKTSADGKDKIATSNNTSAEGTSITTTKTSTDSSDNKTVQESTVATNESGMSLNTSTTVTDKDGKTTSDSSGQTTMTGDSISVSKTTVTKDADGNDVTKTSGTTIGSGEVTLKRENGSTIEVGSAIEGLQGDVQELGGRVNEMGVEIKEVGALSAALAGLHPQPQNANSRADFAMAMGSYEGKQALAVGAFYKPDKRTMFSMGASTTSSKHMLNMGVSIALDKMPEAERVAEDNNDILTERLKTLEADYEARLDKMEAAYEARMARLEARYARLAAADAETKTAAKPDTKADEAAADGEAKTAKSA